MLGKPFRFLLINQVCCSVQAVQALRRHQHDVNNHKDGHLPRSGGSKPPVDARRSEDHCLSQHELIDALGKGNLISLGHR
mmetsp:Transcript_22523/g.46963  ORF Transcript_22523/g.46963 Transcript_22523/m.46963 type:complete len:80 (+) Transcript_22523:234-473(+)